MSFSWRFGETATDPVVLPREQMFEPFRSLPLLHLPDAPSTSGTSSWTRGGPRESWEPTTTLLSARLAVVRPYEQTLTGP